MPMPWTTMVMSPRSAFGVGDRDRDPLAVLVDAEDHELAGVALAGDAGGLDPEQSDVRGEKACFEYGKHDRHG